MSRTRLRGDDNLDLRWAVYIIFTRFHPISATRHYGWFVLPIFSLKLASWCFWNCPDVGTFVLLLNLRSITSTLVVEWHLAIASRVGI